MKKSLLFYSIAMSFALFGCADKGSNKSTEASFVWEVDRFDDVRVLQYRVNDFDSLSLDQKKMIYYLSQAALTGRDILFDQNFKYNLPIRRLLETIYDNYEGDRTNKEFVGLETYLKKVWFANGIHHHYSEDKFTPGFTEGYLQTLIESIPANKLPSTDDLALLTRIIFDPMLYAKRMNQADGEDLVLTSAVNFYEGVTQAEVES